MFDSAKPSQKLISFGPRSDETGGTYQPEKCFASIITIWVQSMGFANTGENHRVSNSVYFPQICSLLSVMSSKMGYRLKSLQPSILTMGKVTLGPVKSLEGR